MAIGLELPKNVIDPFLTEARTNSDTLGGIGGTGGGEGDCDPVLAKGEA